jgi:hypothetical protein
MKRAVTTVLGLVAGFIGGAMSHYLFVPMTVQAQAQSPAEIRAQKFVLVDESGTVRGVFGFRSDGSPDIQIRARVQEPKGIAKLMEPVVESVRWTGGMGRNGTIPDLKLTPPPKANSPSGSD